MRIPTIRWYRPIVLVLFGTLILLGHHNFCHGKSHQDGSNIMQQPKQQSSRKTLHEVHSMVAVYDAFSPSSSSLHDSTMKAQPSHNTNDHTANSYNINTMHEENISSSSSAANTNNVKTTSSQTKTTTTEVEEETTATSTNTTITEAETDLSIHTSVWETYQAIWVSIIFITVLMIMATWFVRQKVQKLERLNQTETSTWNLLNYLQFQKAKDVTVKQSPLGGFHVTYDNYSNKNLSTGNDGQDQESKPSGSTSLSHPIGKVASLPTSGANDSLGKAMENKHIQESYQTAITTPTPTPIDHHNPDGCAAFWFCVFICTSMVIRSFETGFLASMITVIQEDLDIEYTGEGTIAASPDYGLSPGAILAIWTFRTIRAKTVVAIVLFGTAILSTLVATIPTMELLVTARVISGILWAHDAVFSPIWIDRHGPNENSRTVWLAWYNASVLLGLLAGYIIGGLARSPNSPISWLGLYYIHGSLMVLCGIILVVCFDSDLIRNDGPYRPVGTTENDNDDKEDDNDKDDNSNDSVWEMFCALLHSIPYMLSVLINGVLAGASVFGLYFVAQTMELLGSEARQGMIYVSTVFFTAPVPGLLIGSYLVGHLGGYTNHVASFGLSLGASIFVLMASILFPFSEPSLARDIPALFVLANWIFYFAGASPSSPLYGVGVSVLPGASLVASSLLFAISNLFKLFVPQLGGIVCDNIGLVKGFNTTMIVSAVAFMVLSWMGLLHVMLNQALQKIEKAKEVSSQY